MAKTATLAQMEKRENQAPREKKEIKAKPGLREMKVTKVNLVKRESKETLA